MGTHSSSTRRRRSGLAAAAVAVLAAVLVAVLVAVLGTTGLANAHDTGSSSPAAASSGVTAGSPAPVTSSATAPAASSSADSSVPLPVASPAEAAHAALSSAVEQLAAGTSAGSISVAALNTATGAAYQYGATSGMLTGSIVKLFILEVLMTQEQSSGGLSASQAATATEMIENSDNDAAEALFEAIGGRDALIAAEPSLHLSATTPGPGDYWGLTQTSATDYIALLQNLVTATSPLTATSQAYILGLMRGVESDQRWGVGVTADAGTDFANKNGWLAVDDDDDLWLVNSVGVVTIHGQQVLIAVLTQHDDSFQAGIDLVQQLATATASTVAAAS